MTKKSRPDLLDVARQAAVSPATVSRVLTNTVRVRASVRERDLTLRLSSHDGAADLDGGRCPTAAIAYNDLMARRIACGSRTSSARSRRYLCHRHR